MTVTNLTVVTAQEEGMNTSQVELDMRSQKKLEMQKKKKRKEKIPAAVEPVGDAESIVPGSSSVSPMMATAGPVLEEAPSGGSQLQGSQCWGVLESDLEQVSLTPNDRGEFCDVKD